MTQEIFSLKSEGGNNNDADATGVAPYGMSHRANLPSKFDRLPSLLLLKFHKEIIF